MQIKSFYNSAQVSSEPSVENSEIDKSVDSNSEYVFYFLKSSKKLLWLGMSVPAEIILESNKLWL